MWVIASYLQLYGVRGGDCLKTVSFSSPFSLCNTAAKRDPFSALSICPSALKVFLCGTSSGAPNLLTEPGPAAELSPQYWWTQLWSSMPPTLLVVRHCHPKCESTRGFPWAQALDLKMGAFHQWLGQWNKGTMGIKIPIGLKNHCEGLSCSLEIRCKSKVALINGSDYQDQIEAHGHLDTDPPRNLCVKCCGLWMAG